MTKSTISTVFPVTDEKVRARNARIVDGEFDHVKSDVKPNLQGTVLKKTKVRSAAYYKKQEEKAKKAAKKEFGTILTLNK